MAQDAPQTPPAADAPTVTYLGATYAIVPKCLATGFVVGLNQTPAEQTDMLLIAVPFPGGVTVIPPKPVAATGKLASAGLNDAVCLDVTDAP